MTWHSDRSGTVNTTKKIAKMVAADDAKERGEEHMTNYDRWKLATPPYLEDTDGEDETLHGDGTSDEDGEDSCSSDEPDTPNDQG